MSGSEPVNTDRVAKGKGDSRDGSGDDPAEEFEDDPDSEAAADAQQTVEAFVEDDEDASDLSTPESGSEPESESAEGSATPGAVGGMDGDSVESTVTDSGSDLRTLDDVSVAEPSQLAGGIPAAIDEDRDDFHDIRNSIVRGDIMEAEQIFEERLTDEEIDAAVQEIQIQQEIRREYTEIEDASELQIGQEVLYDADRPKRGVIEDVDADGTVWIDNEHREHGGGVNLDHGTVYADPEYDAGSGASVQTYESGRYGLTSNSEVLKNSFSAADRVQTARQAGIDEGNTKAENMNVIDLDDGSRVFATPVEAYEDISTGVVSSPQEAINNNLRSPKVIDALGGNSCKAEVTEGSDGKQYIAKEGVPGDMVSDSWGVMPESMDTEVEKTMAAAYFTGNADLHGANMKISDRGELVIIDNDSAGYGGVGLGESDVPTDISYYEDTVGMRDAPTESNPRERIYDLAVELKTGERELPVEEHTAHHQYAHDAADNAIRAAAVDSSYDLPDGMTPSEVSSPPSGYESTSDYSSGTEIVVVNDDGQIVDAKVGEVNEDEGKLIVHETGVAYSAYPVSNYDRVIEVY